MVVIFVLLKIFNINPDLVFSHPHGGIGSMYGTPGDPWAEQGLACAPQQHVDSQMHVCAHRTLPCGTVLAIQTTRTKKLGWCIVMDRGPYGAIDDHQVWVIKVTESDPGQWRGILDMTPAVTKDMEHRGFEPIRFWILRVGRPGKPRLYD